MTTGFADVEALLVSHLRARLGGRVGTEVPSDLGAHLPMVRVVLSGGGDDRVTNRVRVDVECFTRLRPDARDLAESARAAMHAANHTMITDSGGQQWLIDRVTTEAGPMWIDYADDQVHRFIATYLVESRIRG